ncbi:MAG: hypothetical protein WC291_10390 [Thermodesulfovibrionales bacterium]|jgi:hypothetical protein
MAYTGFSKLRATLTKKPGVTDPSALASKIGMMKYGAKKMAKASAYGKEHPGKKPMLKP